MKASQWNKRLAVLLCFVLVIGCTIAPHAVVSHHKSIGLSGKEDSGIVRLVTPVPVSPAPGRITPVPMATGYIVDADFVRRYNDLIAAYGSQPPFHPPLVAGERVSTGADGTLTISRQGMRNFLLMNGWSQSGTPSSTPKPSLFKRLFP